MKCDRCKKECGVELFHPVDKFGVEFFPDKEFCEVCALQIEDDEGSKNEVNPFKGMTEQEAVHAFANVILGKGPKATKKKKRYEEAWSHSTFK